MTTMMTCPAAPPGVSCSRTCSTFRCRLASLQRRNDYMVRLTRRQAAAADWNFLVFLLIARLGAPV